MKTIKLSQLRLIGVLSGLVVLFLILPYNSQIGSYAFVILIASMLAFGLKDRTLVLVDRRYIKTLIIGAIAGYIVFVSNIVRISTLEETVIVSIVSVYVLGLFGVFRRFG